MTAYQHGDKIIATHGVSRIEGVVTIGHEYTLVVRVEPGGIHMAIETDLWDIEVVKPTIAALPIGAVFETDLFGGPRVRVHGGYMDPTRPQKIYENHNGRTVGAVIHTPKSVS